MRFLLDANVHRDLVQRLRDLGHEVDAVAVRPVRSAPDAEILAIAVAEQRIVITNDRDFGELIFKDGHQHAGVIYLRLGTMLVPEIAARIRETIADPLWDSNQFVVVTKRRIRPRTS